MKYGLFLGEIGLDQSAQHVVEGELFPSTAVSQEAIQMRQEKSLQKHLIGISVIGIVRIFGNVTDQIDGKFQFHMDAVRASNEAGGHFHAATVVPFHDLLTGKMTIGLQRILGFLKGRRGSRSDGGVSIYHGPSGILVGEYFSNVPRIQ